jgi:surface polysaccharide O-acyltransferase-like enzyme
MTKNRIAWMDLARFLAMAFVVILHTSDQLMIKHAALSNFNWSIYQVIRIFGRIGVPLFIMISGSLILPGVSKITVFGFYKKRIPQFVLVLVVYFFATNLTYIGLHHGDLNIGELMHQLASGNTFHAYQLWFMYTIIGLYLVAPFVGRMLQNLTTKEIAIYLSLCLIAYFIPVSQKIIINSYPIYTAVNGEFLGTYLAYFVFGYLVTDRFISRKLNSLSISLGLALSVIFVLCIQFYLKIKGSLINGEGFTWYNSLGIFLVSAFAFLLLSKINDKTLSNFLMPLEFLSASSFCVYLFHLIPLELLLVSPFFDDCSIIIQLAFMATATYASCLLYYSIFRKIKYIRKLVV